MERSPSLPKPSFSRGRRRPPPDYSSRRFQIKLLVLVFALLAMLRLMEETRRPENWKWFFAMQQPSAGESNAPQGGEPQVSPAVVDTRPPAQVASETPDEPIIRGSQSPVSVAEMAESPRDLAAQNALLNGWTIVWDQLANDDQTQLTRGLWIQRQGRSWDDRERLLWPSLVKRVQVRWRVHLLQLRANLERDQAILTEAQQVQCGEVLAHLERTTAEQLAALRAIVEAGSLSPEQAAALAALQQTLDTRAWQAVEDNTVLRSADFDAWNRAWELVALPATTAQAESVSFVQLFAQSQAYRGRAVRFQGTARLGYRVRSRTERQGIDGYYVLWLRPADESDSPLVVYLAALPAGFPSLAERVPPSNGTPLHEEVTVTGLYFKRWLYGSQGGSNLAPLIIGTISQWSPAGARRNTEDSRQSSAPAAFLLTIAAVLVACGLLGWWGIGRRRRDRPGPPADRDGAETLPDFDAADVRGSVLESLQALPGKDDEHA